MAEPAGPPTTALIAPVQLVVRHPVCLSQTRAGGQVTTCRCASYPAAAAAAGGHIHYRCAQAQSR